MAELLVHSGLDWVVIDMEHAPNDLSSVLHQLHATQPAPAEAVVRVPSPDDPALVKTLLDTGVRSILFPMVETASAAAACVAATRYPPGARRASLAPRSLVHGNPSGQRESEFVPLARSAEGIRGVMTTARMSGYATDAKGLQEYYQKAADGICVIVQVESPAAVAAIPEVRGALGLPPPSSFRTCSLHLLPCSRLLFSRPRPLAPPSQFRASHGLPPCRALHPLHPLPPLQIAAVPGVTSVASVTSVADCRRAGR